MPGLETATLLLRAFVEVDSLSQAKECQHLLAQRLVADPNTALLAEPKQYWKVPEWFECTVERPIQLSPDTTEQQLALAQVASSLAHSGWDSGHDSLVWNPSIEVGFWCPAVRWANLELIHA